MAVEDVAAQQASESELLCGCVLEARLIGD
jgi:hypothetical protein